MFLESWRLTLSKRISKEPHFLCIFLGSYLTSLSANFFESFFLKLSRLGPRISVWRNQGGSISNSLAGVVEGPKLFLVQTGEEDAEFTTSEPILLYGAGTWLLDSKAENFLQD